MFPLVRHHEQVPGESSLKYPYIKHVLLSLLQSVLYLAAACAAEADPYLLGHSGLGYGGYGLGYAGLGYAGLGHAGLGHAGLGYTGLANHGLGYAGLGYSGLGHAARYSSVSPSASVNITGHAPAAIPAIAGLYAGAGRYVANSAGTVHVAKREAEADADAYLLGYNGLGYSGLGYSGLGYAGIGHAGLGYAGHGYSGLGYAGLGYSGLGYAGLGHLGHAAGYASVSPSASVNIAGQAPAAIPAVAGAYAGAGRYCANSGGVVHCA